MNPIAATVTRYGGTPEGILLFDRGDAPALLPYATLVAARNAGSTDLQALGGVYEWQDNPLMFLIDGNLLTADREAQVLRLRRRVALRGDTPYLGVTDAGRLTVYAAALDAADFGGSLVPLDGIAEPITFPYLAAERPRTVAGRERWWQR